MITNRKRNKFIASTVTATLVASALVPTAVMADENLFKDLKVSDFGYKEITALKSEGIIDGFPDGTFRPFQLLKREEATKLLMAGLQEQGDGVLPQFSDVRSDSQWMPFVDAAVDHEVMKGHRNGKYGFGEYMSREQMASVLVRAFDLKATDEEISFDDLSFASPTHYEDIKILAQNGITLGFKDGTFKPKEEINRVNFSVFLSRAIEHQKASKGLTSIEEDSIRYNGKEYTYDERYNGLFQPDNLAALRHATLDFDQTDGVITEIKSVEIDTDDDVQLNLHGKEYKGDLTIFAKDVSIKSGNVAGLLSIEAAGSIDLEEVKAVEPVNVSSPKDLSATASTHDGLTSKVTIRNSVLDRLDVEGIFTSVTVDEKTTVKSVYIKENTHITWNSASVPSLTIGAHVTDLTFNGKVDLLTLEGIGEMQLKGITALNKLAVPTDSNPKNLIKNYSELEKLLTPPPANGGGSNKPAKPSPAPDQEEETPSEEEEIEEESEAPGEETTVPSNNVIDLTEETQVADQEVFKGDHQIVFGLNSATEPALFGASSKENEIVFDGDLEVSGNGYINLSNLTVNGTLTLNPGDAGGVKLYNIDATNIVVQSGAMNTTAFEETTADSIRVTDTDGGRILMEGTNRIAKFELDPSPSTTGAVPEFKIGGNFTSSIELKAGLKLSAENLSAAEITVNPSQSTSEITFGGDFSGVTDVNVTEETTVSLEADTTIEKMDIGANVTLKGDLASSKITVSKQSIINVGADSKIGSIDAKAPLSFEGDLENSKETLTVTADEEIKTSIKEKATAMLNDFLAHSSYNAESLALGRKFDSLLFTAQSVGVTNEEIGDLSAYKNKLGKIQKVMNVNTQIELLEDVSNDNVEGYLADSAEVFEKIDALIVLFDSEWTTDFLPDYENFLNGYQKALIYSYENKQTAFIEKNAVNEELYNGYGTIKDARTELKAEFLKELNTEQQTYLEALDQSLNTYLIGKFSPVLADNENNQLDLQTTDGLDLTIEWTSSHPEVVTATGEIKRPAAGEDSVEVTMTALIKRNREELEKVFTVEIQPEETVEEAEEIKPLEILPKLPYEVTKVAKSLSGSYSEVVSVTTTDDKIKITEKITSYNGTIFTIAVTEDTNGEVSITLDNGDIFKVPVKSHPQTTAIEAVNSFMESESNANQFIDSYDKQLVEYAILNDPQIKLTERVKEELHSLDSILWTYKEQTGKTYFTNYEEVQAIFGQLDEELLPWESLLESVGYPIMINVEKGDSFDLYEVLRNGEFSSYLDNDQDNVELKVEVEVNGGAELPQGISLEDGILRVDESYAGEPLSLMVIYQLTSGDMVKMGYGKSVHVMLDETSWFTSVNSYRPEWWLYSEGNEGYINNHVNFTLRGNEVLRRYEEFSYAKTSLKFAKSNKELTVNIDKSDLDSEGEYFYQFESALSELGLTGDQEATLVTEIYDENDQLLTTLTQTMTVYDIRATIAAEFEKEKTELNAENVKKYMVDPWQYNSEKLERIVEEFNKLSAGEQTIDQLHQIAEEVKAMIDPLKILPGAPFIMDQWAGSFTGSHGEVVDVIASNDSIEVSQIIDGNTGEAVFEIAVQENADGKVTVTLDSGEVFDIPVKALSQVETLELINSLMSNEWTNNHFIYYYEDQLLAYAIRNNSELVVSERVTTDRLHYLWSYSHQNGGQLFNNLSEVQAALDQMDEGIAALDALDESLIRSEMINLEKGESIDLYQSLRDGAFSSYLDNDQDNVELEIEVGQEEGGSLPSGIFLENGVLKVDENYAGKPLTLGATYWITSGDFMKRGHGVPIHVMLDETSWFTSVGSYKPEEWVESAEHEGYNNSLVYFTLHRNEVLKEYEGFSYAKTSLSFPGSGKELAIESVYEVYNYYQFNSPLAQLSLEGDQEAVLTIELYDGNDQLLTTLEQTITVYDISSSIKTEFEKEKAELNQENVKKYLRNPWQYNSDKVERILIEFAKLAEADQTLSQLHRIVEEVEEMIDPIEISPLFPYALSQSAGSFTGYYGQIMNVVTSDESIEIIETIDEDSGNASFEIKVQENADGKVTVTLDNGEVFDIPVQALSQVEPLEMINSLMANEWTNNHFIHYYEDQLWAYAIMNNTELIVSERIADRLYYLSNYSNPNGGQLFNTLEEVQAALNQFDEGIAASDALDESLDRSEIINLEKGDSIDLYQSLRDGEFSSYLDNDQDNAELKIEVEIDGGPELPQGISLKNGVLKVDGNYAGEPVTLEVIYRLRSGDLVNVGHWMPIHVMTGENNVPVEVKYLPLKHGVNYSNDISIDAVFDGKAYLIDPNLMTEDIQYTDEFLQKNALLSFDVLKGENHLDTSGLSAGQYIMVVKEGLQATHQVINVESEETLKSQGTVLTHTEASVEVNYNIGSAIQDIELDFSHLGTLAEEGFSAEDFTITLNAFDIEGEERVNEKSLLLSEEDFIIEDYKITLNEEEAKLLELSEGLNDPLQGITVAINEGGKSMWNLENVNKPGVIKLTMQESSADDHPQEYIYYYQVQIRN